ncbi:MAG TPA: ribonuclease HII [Sphingobacteriaceae bacterium]|nr:ribonuclease HII [Sphingobacteriaceae bacterium]
MREAPFEDLPRLMEALAADPRRGCRSLAEQARRRWQREQEERAAYRQRFAHELRFWRRGLRLVAGVDEAGRGPLAGPVVAAAVVLEPDAYLPGLKDSKLLDARRRERLYRLILARALAVAVAAAPAARVDRLNIHRAGLAAMARAVGRLPVRPQAVLVDGFTIPGLPLPQEALVGGDNLSNSIAAAAVVAKVHRDRLMLALHRRAPQYGFARHKGYPTQEHRQAISRFGPSPHHRRSFKW